jgi:hypothetical protein
MFSLIVTIIGLALVLGFIVFTLYHGGATLSAGRTNATGIGLVTFAEQTATALYLREAQGQGMAAGETFPVSALGNRYMHSAPEGWHVVCGESVCRVVRQIPADQADVCLAVNADAGLGRTLDLAVYDLVHARYHCLEQLDEQGDTVGYQFNYLYRR